MTLTPRRHRLDALNAALQEAEGRLYELNPGASGRVPLEEDTSLVWEKIDGKWALGIDSGDGNPTRLLECSVENRLQAALMLGGLLDEIADSLDVESQRIYESTTAANAFLADPQKGLNQ